METERPGPALVGDAAVAIDYVQPVRPARVSSFGRVSDIVDERRNLNVQIPDAGVSHRLALLDALRVSENHILAYVRFHLP